jgi:hypothetical protein
MPTYCRNCSRKMGARVRVAHSKGHFVCEVETECGQPIRLIREPRKAQTLLLGTPTCRQMQVSPQPVCPGGAANEKRVALGHVSRTW